MCPFSKLLDLGPWFSYPRVYVFSASWWNSGLPDPCRARTALLRNPGSHCGFQKWSHGDSNTDPKHIFKYQSPTPAGLLGWAQRTLPARTPARRFAVLVLKDHVLTNSLIRAIWPIRIEPPNLLVRFEVVNRYGLWRFTAAPRYSSLCALSLFA